MGYYGSSALGNPPSITTAGVTPAPGVVYTITVKATGFIAQAAADYCTQYKNAHGGSGAGGPDVEIALSPAGDSCPGVDYAADNSDANEIGGADIFAGACTGGQARSTSLINDTNLGPNVVDAIAQCTGATDVTAFPSLHPAGTVTPCTGSGADTTCGAAATFYPPDNLSQLAAQLLWSGSAADYNSLNGCSIGGTVLQNRISGSGTRATYCLNVFGAGNDLCTQNATDSGGNPVAPAGTTGTEVTDVCGGNGTPPVDATGAIGYITRASVVNSPQFSPGPQVLSGCGLVDLNGKDGYNRNCDPGQVTQGVAQPYTGINTGDNKTTCKGDLQIVDGEYTVWGYEHLDVNHASANNAAAKAFITFTQGTTPPFTGGTPEDEQYQSAGFMRNCQMQVKRLFDAGPYLLQTPSC